MWVLMLNDMRNSKIEILTTVIRSETKEALKEFVNSQKVDSYIDAAEHITHHTTGFLAGTTDHKGSYSYHKSFKKGGILEWYNPPYDCDEHKHYVNVGTEQDWIEEAKKNYATCVLSIPAIPS